MSDQAPGPGPGRAGKLADEEVQELLARTGEHIWYIHHPRELRQFLDAAAVEQAASGAADWIKALRHLEIDGVPLRDRFTYRGDSLWWFAELYLHKQGAIDQIWRTALALDALYRRDKPTTLVIAEGNAVLELLAPQVAQRFGFAIKIFSSQAARRVARESRSRLALDLKSRFYTWSALASRLRLPSRSRGAVASGDAGGTLAFVHSAFWRKPVADGDEGQEGYIGSVLQALQARAEARPVRLVGVGPRTNFKARRWWHAIVPSRAAMGDIPVEPIERFASWDALAGSRAIWRDRFALERALLGSDAVRAHANILGYDAWPLIAEELRGVARLQFPWSARAMDEAAAAMEAVRPALVVTYAEAGGWGRALMLEARRRGIPSVGLQHGFIYRHWLNYQHEADEMQPSASALAVGPDETAGRNDTVDRGFPRPDLTLVYDGYAAQHLTTAGHFPPDAVRVTGSPALDALVASVARVDDAERARIREQLGAPAQMRADAQSAAPAASGPHAERVPEHLIVLVTKFTQVEEALPALLEAVSSLENVRLVIKPHPAETAAPYIAAATAAGARHVTVAPASLDLARLLAVGRLVVTVNSTVAIDAIALGLPALVLALPNNLSPFVEAGVMADGAYAEAQANAGTDAAVHVRAPADAAARPDAARLAATIRALTADEGVRAPLLARARAFAAQYAMQADGRAAERAAEAMVGIMASSRGGRAT